MTRPLITWVGGAVGSCVGELVGEGVGELVGELVGEEVGEPVGDFVGAVGAWVGDVGELVGEAVGELVGEFVGAVGAWVGEGVGYTYRQRYVSGLLHGSHPGGNRSCNSHALYVTVESPAPPFMPELVVLHPSQLKLNPPDAVDPVQ